jgi:DNA-directed RNA polymerase alpha subunit
MTLIFNTTIPETPEPSKSAGTHITELNLGVRVRKATTQLGINTVERLLTFTAKELSELRNFGAVSLAEVREKLADRGLKLKND